MTVQLSSSSSSSSLDKRRRKGSMAQADPVLLSSFHPRESPPPTLPSYNLLHASVPLNSPPLGDVLNNPRSCASAASVCQAEGLLESAMRCISPTKEEEENVLANDATRPDVFLGAARISEPGNERSRSFFSEPAHLAIGGQMEPDVTAISPTGANLLTLFASLSFPLASLFFRGTQTM